MNGGHNSIKAKQNIDYVPTSCYNGVEVENMTVSNKDSVREYHKQLKDMKIRFPKENAELNIPDYAETIKAQAKLLGKSVNEYILDLIENDIRENGLKDSQFTILRDMRELKANL